MGKKRHKQRGRRRPRITINLPELDGIVDSATEHPISRVEATKLKTAIHAMAQHLCPEPRTTEKTDEVVEGSDESPETPAAADKGNPKKKGGRGRNGADAYPGARRIPVPHPTLKAGDCCPECQRAKVRSLDPVPLLRFEGRPAPILGTVWELDRLRCNLCGEIFVARPPEEVGPEKYDETVPAAVALLKYGSGVPFHRQAVLQAMAGVPLAASVQWMLVEGAAELLRPAYEELQRQAAQGEVLHNDDTSMKVLGLARPEGDKRTGVFTTGIVSQSNGHTIALYVTGPKHAGENLGDLLQQRASELPPPTQMCDASSRNVPVDRKKEGIAILLANCMTHGRRQFVDQIENFPEACRHVLEVLGEVYLNDRAARQLDLSGEERLKFHQEQSGHLMDGLREWMTWQLETKQVEPNSGLGKAINYFLKRWDALTLFLRVPGAPLDNNICERALKKAILHRKNALFYRSMNGAQVGDLYMSLIHTCELNGAHPFDYLTQLQRHAEEVRANPADWMPWNYCQAVARGDPA